MHYRVLGLQGARDLGLVINATRNMSLENIRAALTTTRLTDAQIRRVLIARNVAEAEIEQTIATIRQSAANVTATTTTGTLTTATTGLKVAVKGLGTVFLSNPIAWVVAGLSALLTITNKVTQAKDEARQRAEELHNSLLEEASVS